jgi:hypothetical protein
VSRFPLDQADSHCEVLGKPVEDDAGKQGEPDGAACRQAALRSPVEPGVDDDEHGRAGEKRGPRAPRPTVIEGVLEQLEGDRCDQRARRKREQRRRYASGRGARDAEPRAQWQRDRSDDGKEDCLTDARNIINNG